MAKTVRTKGMTRRIMLPIYVETKDWGFSYPYLCSEKEAELILSVGTPDETPQAKEAYDQMYRSVKWLPEMAYVRNWTIEVDTERAWLVMIDPQHGFIDRSSNWGGGGWASSKSGYYSEAAQKKREAKRKHMLGKCIKVVEKSTTEAQQNEIELLEEVKEYLKYELKGYDCLISIDGKMDEVIWELRRRMTGRTDGKGDPE